MPKDRRRPTGSHPADSEASLGDYVQMDTQDSVSPRYSRSTKNNQADLRLLVFDDSTGYRSGRNSDRGTPDSASRAKTRSAGTRPDLRHLCSAWYRTPSFSASGCKPPPALIARSTTASMPPTLQLPVALRQQPPGVALFPTIAYMAVGSPNERERFRKALNDRVKRDHPDVRGRPVWLYNELHAYTRKTGRKIRPPSKQTCAYWLAGTKIPKPEHITLICDALGLTRGELFGETGDARLAAIVERWADLPENMKNGIFSMVTPPLGRTGSE